MEQTTKMKAKKISEVLAEKKFTISVELVPPRNGNSPKEVYDCLEFLSGKIDFVSVTKGAGGSLRGGTLPLTYVAQEKYGLNAVAHFVCRERSKPEIENDLTDLDYLGINNVLALRGDAPAGAKDEVWNGDYQYAYLLVDQISRMNKGLYLPTPTMKVLERSGLPTNFGIIVAGHPEDPWELEKEHLLCKINAGAEVIITQMIFSFEEYKNYVDNLRSAGINLPVLAGVRPLVKLSQATSAEEFFKLKVADELKRGLKEFETEELKSREFGLNYTVEMIRQLKGYGCPGVHLFTLNDLALIKDLLGKI
ncbi:methylenetetrahydrofolate reductase [Candidatus Woesearchaeota archaeon]|nr:methylenetetrahydrofolate reductase [Candidatus Woesearchaeota archaeon]